MPNENDIEIDLSSIDESQRDTIKNVLQNDAVQSAINNFIEQRESGLRSKRDELLTTVTEMKKQIDQFGGIDKIQEITKQHEEAQRRAKEAELKEAEQTGQLDKIKSHYADQLAAAQNENAQFRKGVTDREVKLQIAQAIGKQGSVDLLLPHMVGRVKGELQTSGDVAITVLNPDGSPMLTNQGQPASLKDLVDEFKANERFAMGFNPSGRSGSGADHSVEDVEANPFDKKSPHFNLTKQQELYKQNPTKARHMAALVGVKIE